MCELKVYLDEKQVFEDAVYATVTNGNITLRNILGQVKEFKDCYIAEVDITSERLILEKNKH